MSTRKGRLVLCFCLVIEACKFENLIKERRTLNRRSISFILNVTGRFRDFQRNAAKICSLLPIPIEASKEHRVMSKDIRTSLRNSQLHNIHLFVGPSYRGQISDSKPLLVILQTAPQTGAGEVTQRKLFSKIAYFSSRNDVFVSVDIDTSLYDRVGERTVADAPTPEFVFLVTMCLVPIGSKQGFYSRTCSTSKSAILSTEQRIGRFRGFPKS